MAGLEELHDLRDERGVVGCPALLLRESGAAEEGDLVRQRLCAQADERAGPAAAPMTEKDPLPSTPKPEPASPAAELPAPGRVCPVCGAKLISEKCKVVCRSERCRDRIVCNCAEF